MTNYRIEMSKWGPFHTAHVAGTDNMDYIGGKRYTRFSATKARQRAERWCTIEDRKQRERYARQQQAKQNLFTPELDKQD